MTSFSAMPRDLRVEELDSGFSYCFDYANPAGVTLLSDKAAARLLVLRADGAQFDENSPLDRSLTTSILSHSSQRSVQSQERLSVWLHVIDACNLSCHYCYVPKLRKVVPDDQVPAWSMATGDAVNVARELVRYCRENQFEKLRVKFAGGEPSLNPVVLTKFCEAIESTKEDLNVGYGVITNGTFDDISFIDWVERYGVNISISIDGFEYSHDAIRFEIVDKQRVGTWSTISRNIERLLERGVSPYLLYTVTPENYRDVSNFSRFAHELGLGYRLSLERKPKPVAFETQQDIAGALIEHYEELGRSLSPGMPIARYARFSEWNLRKRKSKACSAGTSYFSIGTHGDINTCQMSVSGKYGSILATSFEDVLVQLSSDKEKHFLFKPAAKDGGCNACEYLRVCAGGCPEHIRSVYGKYDNPSPWCFVYGSLVPIYIKAIANQMLMKLQHPLRG